MFTMALIWHRKLSAFLSSFIHSPTRRLVQKQTQGYLWLLSINGKFEEALPCIAALRLLFLV